MYCFNSDDLFDDEDDEDDEDEVDEEKEDTPEIGNPDYWKFDDETEMQSQNKLASDIIINDESESEEILVEDETDMDRISLPSDPDTEKEWDLDGNFDDMEAVPTLALMYKLRVSPDNKMDLSKLTQNPVFASHAEYCKSFERVMHTETIAIEDAIGVVILWAGEIGEETTIIRQDIQSFLSRDPLQMEGLVESYDVIDLMSERNVSGAANSKSDTTKGL